MKRTPLKRKSLLRARRPGPPRKGRIRDGAYLDFVRSQPCAVPGCPARDIEAHHWGARGLGQKCDDTSTAPLCGNHHRAWWHDKGHLPGMTTAESKQLIESVGLRLLAEWNEG